MFRDEQRIKLEVFLAKHAPTAQQKLDRATSLAHDLIARWDLGIMRADDANFVESDHPRGPDGKFTKGSGAGGAASHGIAAYEKILKKGAKGSAAGLMKHMLATGDYSESDIFQAAQVIYNLPDDKKGYVKWYAKDLAKTGTPPPPMPAKSKVGGDEAPKPAAASGPAQTAASTPSGPPPAVGDIPVPDSFYQQGLKVDAEKGDFTSAENIAGKASHPDKEYAKKLLAAYGKPVPGSVAPATPAAKPVPKTLQEKSKHYLPPSAHQDLEMMFPHMGKLTEENKPKVEGKLKELFNALAENEGDPAGTKEALAKIQPIDGMGLSIAAVNSAIEKTQAAHAGPATSSGSSYTPSTPAQKKAFDKLKKVPHFRQDHVNYFEDHEGNELKAVLNADTKKIPGDHYALVSSAYAGNKGEGNTSAVASAMHAYGIAAEKSLTNDESLASMAYKGSTYSAMNKYMLGQIKTPDPYIKKYVDDMRSAVNKSVIPADTPAFRGMRCSLKDLSGFEDAESSVGRCFEHKNFASISRNRDCSEGFAGKGGSHKKILMKMTVPAGANGLVLGSQNVGSEAEIVLPDKCTFRIDKVEPWDNGKGHFIHVTYLGVREDA